MCILFASNKGLPKAEVLMAGEKINTHGGGIAIAGNKTVYIHKGIDAAYMIKHYSKVKLPMLIHFRIATVGEKVPALTHPFPATEKVELDLRMETDLAFAHNGGFKDWQTWMLTSLNGHIPPGNDWSDSRAIAYLVWRYGEDILQFLPAGGSRFATLNKEGKIRRWGDWTKLGTGDCEDADQEIYASNMLWKNPKPAHHHVGMYNTNYNYNDKPKRNYWNLIEEKKKEVIIVPPSNYEWNDDDDVDVTESWTNAEWEEYLKHDEELRNYVNGVEERKHRRAESMLSDVII